MRKSTFMTINLLMILAVVLFMLFPVMCRAEFTVDWDENNPVPDGYSIYVRTMPDGNYNYDAPVWEGLLHPVTLKDVHPALPDVLSATDLAASYDKRAGEVSITWTQPPNTIVTKTYALVVRAFLNPVGTNPRLESEDSDEVTVDQSVENATSKWEVFYSETSGGPYISLGDIPADQAMSLTNPVTAVAAGEVKTLYFTVVTFGENDMFSPNSAEVSVLVDRRVIPTPPVNIKVTVTFPIQ